MISCLLICSPLCPGRIPSSAPCKQGLLSTQEDFLSRFFDTSGSGAAQRSPSERIRLRPLPCSSKTISFFPFTNRTGVKKPNQNIRNYFLLAAGITQENSLKKKKINCISKLFSAAGKSHLGFFFKSY